MKKFLLTALSIVFVLPATANDRPTLNQVPNQVPQAIAPSRLSRRGGVIVDELPYQGGQWFQTYNAYGERRLKDATLYVGTNESDAKALGGITYTYDDEGYESSCERIYIWGKTMAGDIILGKSYEEEDNQHRNIQLWLKDTITGEWILHSSDYCIHSPYGGDLESEYKYYMDELGRVVTMSKVISQYDDQNRPIETIWYNNTDENLDSLVPSYRQTYEYNEAGIPLIGTYYWRYDYWDAWSANRYFESDKSSTREDYYWNTSMGRWLPSKKVYEEYENTNIVLEIIYNGNYSGEWTPKSKDTWEYNSLGNGTVNREYSWSYDAQDWFLSEEHHTDYLPGDSVRCAEWAIFYSDGSGISDGSESTDGATPGPKATGERREFSYDSFGRETMRASYTLATLTPLTWEGCDKYERDYNDPTGEKYDAEVTIGYSWNYSTGQWVYSRKDIYKSDAAEYLSETWNWDGTKWVIEQRYHQKFQTTGGEERMIYDENLYMSYGSDYTGNKSEWTYDAAGNELSSERFYWDNEIQDWKCNFIEKYKYNDEGFAIESEEYGFSPYENLWSYSKSVYEMTATENRYNVYTGQAATIEAIVPELYSYNYVKYDARGNVILSEGKQSDTDWETGNRYWSFGEQMEMTYNDQDSVILAVLRTYDAESDQFVNSIKQDIEYGQSLFGLSHTKEVQYQWNLDEEKWDTVAIGTLRVEGNTQFLEIFSNYGEWIVTSCTKTTLDPTSGSVTVEISEYDGEGLQPKELIENIVLANGREMRHSYYYGEEIGWQMEEKTVDTDVEGLITIEEYRWNGYEFTGRQKTQYKYDDYGYKVFDASFYWSNNEWVNNEKKIAQYDSLGGVLSMERYRWNSYGNEWYGYSKEEHAFDALHNEIMNATYSWDNTLKAWVGNSKRVEVKDSLENTLLYERYSGMRDGKWIGYEKYENAYDAEGFSIMSARYVFDYDSLDWRGTYKSESGDGNDYASYIWDNETWAWVGESKSCYEYTDSTSTREMFKWDKSTGTWTGDKKYIWKNRYDDFNEYALHEVFIWKDGQWVESEREISLYRYDTEYNIIDELETNEKKENGQWIYTAYAKQVYNYTGETAVRTAKAANASVSVSDGVISVESCADITIMTANGQAIAAGNGSVSVSVPSGIYLIKSANETIKVIVK